MTQLAFDFDVTPEWVLVGEWGRCGLCGAKGAYNQGSSSKGQVCDECARIDECRLRVCTPVAERRKGANFTVDELAHCDSCGWFLLDRSSWEDDFDADGIVDVLAEHARPRHVSHWGSSHFPEEHDGLVRAQAKRRARYLAERAA